LSGGIYREIVGGALAEIPQDYKQSLSKIARWFLEAAVTDEEKEYLDRDDRSDYSDEDDIPTDNAYLLSLLASCYLSIDASSRHSSSSAGSSESLVLVATCARGLVESEDTRAIFSAAKCLEKILYSTGEDGPDIRDSYELAQIYLRLANPHPAVVLLKTCLETRNFRDFAKSAIKRSQMESLLDRAKEAFDKLPALRFGIGTEVECNLGERGYRPGVVVAHYYRETRFKPNFTACYQVRLTDEKTSKGDPDPRPPLIYAPVDSDYYIRLRSRPKATLALPYAPSSTSSSSTTSSSSSSSSLSSSTITTTSSSSTSYSSSSSALTIDKKKMPLEQGMQQLSLTITNSFGSAGTSSSLSASTSASSGGGSDWVDDQAGGVGAGRGKKGSKKKKKSGSKKKKKKPTASSSSGGGGKPSSSCDEAYLCPITKALMEDPVLCVDGYTYERSAIEQYLKTHTRSPCTDELLGPSTVKKLVPNEGIKARIVQYKKGLLSFGAASDDEDEEEDDSDEDSD
jgi:hypothetical protein